MALADDIKSIPHLVGDVAEQFAKLVQNEARLAKAELAEKLEQAGRGAVFLAGAAMLAIPVIVMLLITMALWFIQLGFSPITAHLLATFTGAALCGALGLVGLAQFKNLKPKATLREIERDVAAAKEMTK